MMSLLMSVIFSKFGNSFANCEGNSNNECAGVVGASLLQTTPKRAGLLSLSSTSREDCVDTAGWINGFNNGYPSHGCDVYAEDWCHDGRFWGIAFSHNYPNRNCCACGKGSNHSGSSSSLGEGGGAPPAPPPVPQPTLRPSPLSTPRPPLPTLQPSPSSTPGPTLSPSLRPTFRPTLQATLRPSPVATPGPTLQPTLQATLRPSPVATPGPTLQPTLQVQPTPSPQTSSGTCRNLRANDLPARIQVTEIALAHQVMTSCGGAAESPPCNGLYYAGSDQHEYHAILYNTRGSDGFAFVVLEIFDGNNVRRSLKTYTSMETTFKGHMQIRGLDFTPDGNNLVAYFGGGRGLNQGEYPNVRPGGAPFGAKSVVVNIEIPSFREKWKRQIFSKTNVMELSVAGVTQNLALSNEDFLVYTTGMGPVGPEGYTWLSGGCCHQWGYVWSVDAATGQQGSNADASGPTFGSHSLVHGAAYSKLAGATLSFHTQDRKNSFVLSVMKGGAKVASTSHNVWGGGYTSGATPGYVAASGVSGDFGVVMSIGCTTEITDQGHHDWTGYKGCAIEGQDSFVPLHGMDKVFFMKVNDRAEIQNRPRQIFSGDETQIAPALQPLPDGKWLLAYTASNRDLWRSTKDYSKAHSGVYYTHMWTTAGMKESMKSKLAILDNNGYLEGSVESPGKFPIELHPLKPRGPHGFGWAFVEKGAQTVQISRLVC